MKQPKLKVQESTEEFLLPGNHIGVLLVHGFSSSPTEMRGLAEHLNKHGYTVLAVRLAGHGTTPADMRHTNLNDWVKSAKMAAEQLFAACDQVCAVGQSMGGLICLKLAVDLPFSGVVAMSPPMFKPTWEWRILPIAKHFIRWYTIGGGLDPSTYQPPYTVKAYPKVATSNLGEFLKLVSEIRRVAPKITIPILLMQGDLDGIAPSSSGDELLDILGSYNKELKHYPKSNHVLPVDSDRKQVWEDIQKFIDKQK